MHAICNQSLIPLRSQANHSSELLSQILYGELMIIDSRKGKAWCKVRCISDNSVGWVASQQIHPISKDQFDHFNSDFAVALDLVQPIRGENFHFPIPIGARLPDFDGMRFSLDGEDLDYSGQAVWVDNLKNQPFEIIPKIARKFLNAPQMAGGRSPLGIDSAALVQLIYSFIGIELPRYCEMQVEQGEPVDFTLQMQMGDIAFFENSKGRINHCGIVLEDNQIIHSYGNVRIDLLDQQGIFNSASAKYSHKLRVMRRFLPEMEKRTIEELEKEVIQVEQKALF